MERFYFFARMRVVLLLSLFTLSFSSLSFAQEYALEVVQQNGIDGPACILGAPDGYGAQLWTDGDFIIVKMTDVIPAGSQYFITWRKRASESGSARPYLYESSNGSNFNENPGANTTSSSNWVTSSYVATQNFEYLKILKQSPNSVDFDIDAISYCPPAEQANLISTCEITGYASTNGRIFYLPGFGTDFKASGAGLFFDKFDNGTAHLRGEIVRISNGNAKFLVSLWFHNESNYTEWLAQGLQAHSPNLGDESTWIYYSFDDSMPNTLIGLANYDGEVLYLADTGSGFGLQIGDGANALNSNDNGISTWFDYSGTTNGSGDINGTINCEPNDCHNVTSAGEICCDQTGCAPFNPGIIANVTLPSGGSGALEYVWLSNTTAGSINGNEQLIPGANGHSYDPGVLTQTTWFRRCARRAGCSDYVGESNWVKVTVENCPVGDWSYDCEDGIEVEIYGEGIQNGIPAELVFDNPENIDHVVVEAVYKSCNPGSTLNFVDADNNNYPASREVPSGTSSNVWVYRTTLPATSSARILNANNEWCAQSFTAYVFRATGNSVQSSGMFTSRSGYNDVEVFVMNIPTDVNVATRNLTVELPVSELTPDGRYIYVSASSGGVTESFSERIFDFGGENCCYKIYTLNLNNVPGNASQVTITVDTRHNVHQPANGQSWVLAGAIKTDVECGVVCEVECLADVELDCDANIHPDFTGYPSLVCDENIDCAREAGDFDLVSEHFNGDAAGWNFGAGWMVGSGCAPACGTIPNAFIDYSNFHTPYNTKLTSPLLDACCTDEVELSLCLRQDLYGSSDVPGYLDVQYRILGGSWQTIATYTSVYGSTIDYNDTYSLPVTGQQFEVRFKAYGNGSSGYTMGGWGLDNVVVSAHSPGCAPSPTEVNIDWTYSDELSGSCPQVITRTFEGSYEGEVFTCVQTLTLVDEIPPVFYMVEEDATYQCLADVPVTYAFAMDNCDDNVVVTSNDHISDSSCPIIIERVFTAIDDCGNEAYYTQIITVLDTEAPEFDQEVSDLNVACGETIPNAEILTASDNCDGNVEVTFDEEIIGSEADKVCEIADGDNHTMWFGQNSILPNSTDKDFMSVGNGTFEAFPDGTARFTGLVANQNNANQRFAYEVWLRNASTYEEWTSIPNANTTSGFREEKLDAGTTVTITDEYLDWTYYEIDPDKPNKLVGEGAYAGIEFDLFHAPADYRWGVQVGDRASLQSTGFGLSTWFTLEGMVNGQAQNSNGDFNFRLNNCVEIPNEPTCTESYSIVRTWTATDDCGNSAVQTQTITVGGDNEAPEFVDFPEDQTGLCDDTFSPAEVTAIDNCDEDVDVNVSEEIIGEGCEYTIIYTYTATDDCENETTASYSIQVSDNTPPVLVGVPADADVECSSIPAAPMVTANDNCDNDVTAHLTESTVIIDDCNYQIIRTWTAADDCGNEVSASQTLNVTDNTAPVASNIPEDQTFSCEDDLPEVNVTFNDNCDDDLSISIDNFIVDLDCGFEYHKSCTATDDCGNSTTVTVVYTVIDDNDPFIVSAPASEITIECGDTEPTEVPVFGDACDDQLTLTAISGIANVDECGYDIQKVWSATDECGNSTSFSQVIRVRDTEAPEFDQQPQDMEVECDAIPQPMVVTATDECSGAANVSFSQMISSNDCPYEITRTWTAIDDCGNTASITQVLTVVDNVPPVLVGVPTDTNAECDAIPSAPEVSATDNCDSDVHVSLVETNLPGDGCTYQLRRTWTATDNCGNSASQSQLITITDTTPPTATEVPAELTIECGEEVPETLVTFSDNCDSDLEVTVSTQLVPNGCLYDYVKSCTATDDCGNSTTVTQTITVIDTTEPELIGVPADVTVDCENIPAVAEVTAYDICDDNVHVSFNEVEVENPCGSTITRTWTAVDDCGNTTVDTQIITVNDLTPPVIVCPADYVVNCDNGSSDPADSGMATATDNCSSFTITFADGVAGDDCPSVFERTWTATDACGNSSSCVQLITINDFEAPVITCPADITVECTESLAPDNTGMASATDDCSMPVISFVDGPANGDCPYSFERTWTAVDPCGNSSSCVQIITVDDTVAPVLSGEDAVIDLECDVQPNIMEPEVSDNCDASVDVDFNFESTPGSCPNDYTEVYTWTATDNCGNTAVRVLTFNFSDTTPPTLMGVPDDITISCDEQVPSAIVWAQDNCDEDLIVSLTVTSLPLDCGMEMTRTWSTVDDCGNEVSASQVVTIIDETEPFIVSAPDAEITIECGDPEPTEAPVFDDNCDEDLDILAISGITNVTDCGYDIERSWTAVDDCGNSFSFSQVIRVLDTQAPMITCPADYVVNCDNGSSDPADSGMATAWDACSDPVITYVDGLPGDECPSFFERTWTATDACGNSSSCIQMITINDFEAPMIMCPPTVTVECGDSIDPEVLGFATATDDCSIPEVTYTDSEVSGGCPNSVLRTWKAVDACGNEAFCSQLIQIRDLTPPVISGEDDEITIDCNQAIDIIAPTVSDACDLAIELDFEFELIPGDCPNERTEVYTWSAMDFCGNFAARVIRVNYVDNEAPVLSGVPSDATYSCDELIPVAEVTAEDNCDQEVVVDFSESTEDFDCGSEITRTWSAMDDCGNMVSATQVITIVDETDPFIVSAPEAEITIECGDAEPTEAPVFDDNCDEVLDLFAISGINNVTDCGYDIERTWSATDDCGNSISFSQVIHVLDTQAPVITCPADYVVNCDGGSSDPADSGMATATDVCSEVSISYVDGIPTDECPSVFERTWTATDVCGNSSSCVQLITINDFEAPVITCPADITVECTESLDPSNTGSATATDDCSEPLVTYVDGPITGDCPYSFERTWTAVDPCGNSSSCVQVITVDDTIAPVLTGQDETLELECDVQPIVVAPEVSDNCDLDVEVVPGFTTIPGTCPNNYTEVYTWTATDNCGNTTVRTLTFIFSDNTPPVLIGVPADVTISCDAPVPAPIVTAQDNCDDELIVSLSASSEAEGCNTILTRVWSTVDDCGNMVSATQVITIVDETDPFIVSAPEAEITIECGDSEPTEAPVFDDNCDEVLDLFAISGINNVTDCGYDIERTWSATDDCGNSVSFSQVIHVLDTEAPVITCPADYVVNCDGGSSDPADSGMATATDVCSEVSISYVDGNPTDECPSVFERTWTATDVCGNSSSCVQLITINDFEAPVITCPADITVECTESLAPENTGMATATDDCSEPLITFVDGQISGDCPYSFERTWTAVDPCGNSSSCVQVITVDDTIAPVLTGQDETLELECDVQPFVVAPEVSDNCDLDVEVVPGFTTIPGTCPNNYTEVYTWTATDNCGNSTVRTLTFIFSDNTDPELEGVPADVTVECTDIPAIAEVTAFDNCSDVVPVYSFEVEDLPCGEIITRTWTATDECGNSTSESQVITVIDVTDPVLVGVPQNTTVSCDAIPAPAQVSATDNCDDTVVAILTEQISEGCPYTITRTWTATDVCGNSTTESQVITVIDETDPVATFVPEGYSIECDLDIPLVEAEFSDNCTEILDIDFSETRVDFDCGAEVTRSWTATDACGNSTNVTQVIEVIDETAPVFDPYEIDIEMPCTEIDMNVLVTATDNCDLDVDVSFTDTYVSGGCAGRIIRDYLAVDNCGNEATAQQIITLIDNFDPEAVFVPASYSIECDQPIEDEEPEWFDNCDENLNIVFDETSAMEGCNQILTRTWTATDHCLNSTTVTQTITIIDTTNPILIGVPDNATVECDNIPAPAEVVAQDNCDTDIDVLFSEAVISEGCPYTIERTWTASDDCGNSVTETQILVVVDSIDPELTNVPENATVSCDDIPAPAVVGYTDNCATDLIVQFSETEEVFECGSEITRTWTVVDYCGNSATATQILTVIDETDPVLIGVPADTTAECDNVPAAAIVSAEDNCSLDLVVAFNQTEVILECGYEITRTWSTMDDCGNEVSATQVITVVDTTLPVITSAPADIEVECDAIPEFGTIEAFDNCDENLDITTSEEFEEFECGGILTRTWVATDDCGNSSAISQVITVVDNTPPVLVGVPGPITIECGETVELPVVTASDICDGELEVMFTEEENQLACGYEIIRTWRAADACGNYSIESQTITVQDLTAPVLSDLPQNEVVNCDDDIIAPVLTASDVCDGPVEVFYNEEIGEGCPYTIVRTWTASDNCGNTVIHEQVVTVVDEVNPVFEVVESEVTISCDEISAYMLTATDNCDDDVEVSFSDAAVGFNDPNADRVCEMLDPIDASPEWSLVLFGMPFNLNYYITTEAYFLEYPDGTAHLVGHVFSTVNPNAGFDIDVWFQDGLGWEEWSNQDFPTDYKDDQNLAGNNYLDWTYYIMNGAMATLTGTGDYEGTLLSLSHAPNNKYFAFQVGVAANNRNDQYGIGGWFYYNGIFVDAESGYNSTVSGAGDFAFDGNCCGANDVERTWVAVDNCGNETLFVQTIHIVDEEAPILFNIPENVTLYCGDDIPEVPANIEASDNCDPDVTITFSEVQSNEFCPYTITRTWTAVDECGNITTATQVITVEFEAEPEVFLFGYPNPFNDHFTVQFTVPADAFVVAKVYDVTGREVFNIVQGDVDAERLYQYTVNNIDWGAGAYTIMLLVDDRVYHHKMLIIQR